MAEFWRGLALEGWEWVKAAVGSAVILAAAGLFLKDSIAKFLAKSVDHRFEKQIEAFRAEIREGEKELDQIRSFISSARGERHSILLAKKIEAAETLLRTRNFLSRFSVLVEYTKILDKDFLLKNGDDPKVIEFITTITTPFEVDKNLKIYGEIDRTLPRLYISEKTIKIFDAYEAIIFRAIVSMKLYAIAIKDKSSVFNSGQISKVVTDLVPAAKDGFEKYGDDFAYYWSSYFYEETLRSLRHEISGMDDALQEAASAERIALDVRQAQLKVKRQVAAAGLSQDIIKINDDAGATALVQRMTER